MILNGISIILAPLVSALIGMHVKPPPEHAFGRFVISLMMGLISVTYFTLRLHLAILERTLPIGTVTINVQELLFCLFFVVIVLLLVVAMIFDKVSNPYARNLAASAVAVVTYAIAFIAVVLPPNLAEPK